MRLLPLLLLCAWLVGDAACSDDVGSSATIDRILGRCRSFLTPMCRTCSGKCVRGRTVSCLESPCASNPCAKDEKCIDNFCGGCNACCLKRPYCSRGHRTCPDGSRVFRDPNNNCEFPKCECPPKGWTRVAVGWKCWISTHKCEPGYEKWSHGLCGCGCKPVSKNKCDDDERDCPDGSTVVRDPANKCRFPRCECPPKGWTRVARPNSERCKKQRFRCKAGYEKWSDDNCGCGCKPPGKCNDDVRECPDSSIVVRDPKNKCRFPRCKCRIPESWTREGGSDDSKCKKLTFKCGPGYKQWSNDNCGCGCRPGKMKCDDDVRVCADGSKLVRDPERRCRLPRCECPPKGWTREGRPNSDTCKKQSFRCKYGYEKWSHDDCGCGCKPLKNKCDNDVRVCPDGSKVYRDPKDKCRFGKCDCKPSGWTIEGGPRKCEDLKYYCKPGFEKWSHDTCGCGCKPVKNKCKGDVEVCPDGSKVYRDPANKCRFPKCECPPKGWKLEGRPNSDECKKNSFECKPGYEKWSHDDCGCGCKPMENKCKNDVRECPDGSKVYRDPANKCRFGKCDCKPSGWTIEGGPRKCKDLKYYCKPGFEKWSHDRCGCGCKPGTRR